MPADDYTSTPSTGKLKLKGVKDSKVAKKRKHKPVKDDKPVDDVQDNSIMLKKLEDEDAEMEREEVVRLGPSNEAGSGDAGAEESGLRVKTEAERRYEEQRRKRVRLINLPSIVKARMDANGGAITMPL